MHYIIPFLQKYYNKHKKIGQSEELLILYKSFEILCQTPLTVIILVVILIKAILNIFFKRFFGKDISSNNPEGYSGGRNTFPYRYRSRSERDN